jgi:hypothetical protein
VRSVAPPGVLARSCVPLVPQHPPGAAPGIPSGRRADVSKDALDEIVRRAVADPAFRVKLGRPESFEAAVSAYNLTAEEKGRLRKMMGKAQTMMPFASDLGERLSK